MEMGHILGYNSFNVERQQNNHCDDAEIISATYWQAMQTLQAIKQKNNTKIKC